jgi:folylpolyglutamate synthase/dihydrofolate synthase
MPGRRTLQASLEALQRLQANGLRWMKNVRSRDQVVQSMLYFMTRLGIDVSQLPPVVHVAGTKGKGSTAAMAESILRQAGPTTGLFTSPHLISPTERFRVNGKSVSEKRYLDAFWGALDILQREDGAAAGDMHTSVAQHEGAFKQPPALLGFNLLTLVALKLFAEEGVDVMVLEVGLGGRLDATNTLPRPLVCGVTTLDFDHTEFLGSSLADIAGEKAGIFKPGVPAITVHQPEPALRRLSDVAAQTGTPLFLSDPAVLERRAPGAQFPALGLRADFQRANAALAVALCDVVWHQVAAGRAPSLERFLEHSGASAQLLPEQLVRESCPPHEVRAAAATRDNLQHRRAPCAAISPFRDTFGASKAPPVGLAVFPPQLYDRDDPLSAAALRGLQEARWPGRAQSVTLSPLTAKVMQHEDSSRQAQAPAGDAPALRMLLDGAHTEASMRAAASWFVAEVAAHTARTGQAPRLTLVFNCGFDKDALQLMLPLSAVSFDDVYVTTVPWVLAPKQSLPSAATVLSAFVSKRGAAADRVVMRSLLPGVVSSEVESPLAVGKAAPDSLEWQRTLAELWSSVPALQRVLQTDGNLVNMKREAEGLVAETDQLTGSRADHLPPARVVPAAADVLQAVARQCAADKRDTLVFVTGSLYLVGAMLQEVGWHE